MSYATKPGIHVQRRACSLPKRHHYEAVSAYSNLPAAYVLYQALEVVPCARCGASIARYSYFSRRIPLGTKKPQPHCRTCVPFDLYTDASKTVIAPVSEEWCFVARNLLELMSDEDLPLSEQDYLTYEEREAQAVAERAQQVADATAIEAIMQEVRFQEALRELSEAALQRIVQEK